MYNYGYATASISTSKAPLWPSCRDDGGRIVGVAVRENYNFNPDFESDDLENTSGVVKHYRAVRGVIMAAAATDAT